MAVDGEMWHWSRVAIDKLRGAEHADCKLFVVGWQEAG